MASNLQWIGNRTTREFHRLENNKPGSRNCQIPEIKSKNRREFSTKRAAKAAKFDPCAWCQKGSTR